MTNNNPESNCEQLIAEFKQHSSHNCQKNGECIKYIQLYLDNMACKLKDSDFLKGTSDCKTCCDYFQINDCIKNNLKNKVYELELSSDFIDKVKNSVYQENYYTKK